METFQLSKNMLYQLLAKIQAAFLECYGIVIDELDQMEQGFGLGHEDNINGGQITPSVNPTNDPILDPITEHTLEPNSEPIADDFVIVD